MNNGHFRCYYVGMGNLGRLLGVLVLVVGCTSSDENATGAGTGGGTGGGTGTGDVPGTIGSACSDSTETTCSGSDYLECVDGVLELGESCTSRCDASLGCIDCIPADEFVCSAKDVYTCTETGELGEFVKSCDPQSCSQGACTDAECASGTDLIYVVDSAYNLLSFDPRDNAYINLGAIECDGAGTAKPFSMSVDRNGIAWVLYNNGSLFFVDINTENLDCVASSYVPNDAVKFFGMGFASDTPGASTETLFVAGGPNVPNGSGADVELGAINPNTQELTVGETVVVDQFPPELTGTGNGKIYGYFPSTNAESVVSEIDRDTGEKLSSRNVGQLVGNVRAWAFAHWGGRFYIFITTNRTPEGEDAARNVSDVVVLDPLNTETPVSTILPDTGFMVVGAGVSTCAPVAID